jgi:hypothetical protein
MRRPLLLSALACLALCAPALASPGQTMTFEAPRDLSDPATRESAFGEIESLGARSLRVILYWRDVAPSPDARRRPEFDLTDPAVYDWSHYDAIVDGARDRGWSVQLTVSGPVPRWATARRRDHVTRPSAKQFRAFMTAAGRHFRVQVDQWAAWNEPNHPDFLKPQYGKGKRPLSPRIYRKLFLAMWRGLRASGNGHDILLMGETAPRGTGSVVAPITFMRKALCLDRRWRKRRKCSNLPADGYAHHAYTTRIGPFFRPDGPNDVTIGVLRRLVRALDLASASGAVRREMPIYLTEFGIQTNPPDRIFGVSLRRQAEYYALSERIAYRNRRVKAFSQYLLTDDNRTARGQFGGFESGLKFADGRVKRPGYEGFRLPLAAVRGRTTVALWGRVRPAQGATTVEVLYADRGRSFRRLRTTTTDAHATFNFRTRHRQGRRYRLRWTAADGTVYTGPPIRSYSRRGKVG